jgi:hypothetical protein
MHGNFEREDGQNMKVTTNGEEVKTSLDSADIALIL